MTTSSITLLDTTLRDGSYAVNFQFSANDTERVVRSLERGGIRYIEIGHGLGLGAYRNHGTSCPSDREHFAAAMAVAEKARIGAFFLPSVGRTEDLAGAAAAGAQFIRLGSEVREVAEAAPFIREANALGLEVFVNLLKTYATPPAKLGAFVQTAAELGADAVYIVDSAGGMLPDEVRQYVDSALQACSLPIGFHGHDNLALAVANSLAAVEAGASFVDSTLRGLGRSEGNAVTEILAALLVRAGSCDELDVAALMSASDEIIAPLLAGGGRTSLGITAGLARFHSSRMGSVIAAAQSYGVNPRDIMIRLSEFDLINPSQDLIEVVARDLRNQ